MPDPNKEPEAGYSLKTRGTASYLNLQFKLKAAQDWQDNIDYRLGTMRPNRLKGCCDWMFFDIFPICGELSWKHMYKSLAML